MTTYDNLLRLAKEGKTIRRGTALITAHDNVEVHMGVWRPHSNGHCVALVYSDNSVVIDIKGSNQYVNLVFGTLGLGSIHNGTTNKARLVYWYQGRAWLYTPGMCVDLTTGLVEDVTPLDELSIDTKERYKLLKLIRSKAPQAQSYLRVAGITTSTPKKQYHLEPADFVEAVYNDRTAAIACIPIVRSRSWRDKRPHDPLHECYGTVLAAYIDQNRAELYRAAGVVK